MVECTEQFLYEIAKKYKDYDIEVMYEIGDEQQIARLSKFVKCTKWEAPTIVECDKYFANFNLDQAKYVKANEYYFCIHANFNEIGYKPNIALLPPNAKFIGVSKWARDEFIKFTGKPATYCYNPLTLEPVDKVVHLVSACRLNDEVKGGKRTRILAQALDKYCLEHNRHYIWHIFTNETTSPIDSPNVCLMKPRIDVRPYIADADVGLQLSNDMETYCYTLAEFYGYSTMEHPIKIVTTPLSVLPEHNIPKGVNKILEWDCSNVDEVARWIMEEKIQPYTKKPLEDDWADLLSKGESQYQKELSMKYKVKAIAWDNNLVDNEVGRARELNEEWIVDHVRLEKLQNCDQIKLEVQEVVENAIQEPKAVKKAVRKTTKSK